MSFSFKTFKSYIKKCLAVFTNQSARDWDNFYSRFEDHFRGTEELISVRLKERYGQLLLKDTLVTGHTKRTFLDLGCGRGEFLDLAKASGYQTIGVDGSGLFCRKNKQKGHLVAHNDILKFLRQRPDASVDFCTLMHVIEHLDHKYAYLVCLEIFRVLAPGGIFIIETPSLFSLWTGARQFYLDPTHLRPIHPDYLNFLCGEVGFARRELKFFAPIIDSSNPSVSLASENRELLQTWQSWLFGPQDCAIIAQKN